MKQIWPVICVGGLIKLKMSLEDILSYHVQELSYIENEFLDSLLEGSAEESAIQDYINRSVSDDKTIANTKSDDDVIMGICTWMEERGLNSGEMFYDLSDDAGTQIATVDLAWPEGIQSGLSEPVALLLGASTDVLQAVNRAGYRYFTHADTFKQYVEALIS